MIPVKRHAVFGLGETFGYMSDENFNAWVVHVKRYAARLGGSEGLRYEAIANQAAKLWAEGRKTEAQDFVYQASNDVKLASWLKEINWGHAEYGRQEDAASREDLRRKLLFAGVVGIGLLYVVHKSLGVRKKGGGYRHVFSRAAFQG